MKAEATKVQKITLAEVYQRRQAREAMDKVVQFDKAASENS